MLQHLNDANVHRLNSSNHFFEIILLTFQAAIIALSHISFNHNARRLSEVLDVSIPPSTAFASLALPIDRVEQHRTHTLCQICGRRSVLDVILSQINSSQFDIPLIKSVQLFFYSNVFFYGFLRGSVLLFISMCLDFLEDLLTYAPEIKRQLFYHGAIEVGSTDFPSFPKVFITYPL